MNVHAAVNLNAWISGDFTGGVLRISDYIKILWHDHLKSLFLFSSKLLKLFARRVFFLIQRWWYRGRGGFFALHLLFSTPEIWKRWWYRRENKSFRLKTTKKDDVWDGYEISSKLLTLFADRDIFSASLLLLFLILVWSWWWYRGQTDLFDSKGKNNDVHNGDDYGDGGDDDEDDYGVDNLPQGDEGCTQKEVQSHHHQLLHPRQPLKTTTKCHRGNCRNIFNVFKPILSLTSFQITKSHRTCRFRLPKLTGQLAISTCLIETKMILDDPLWSSLMILNDSQLYLMISNYPYWSVMWWSFVIPLKWSLILSTNLLIPDVKADVGPKVCLRVAQLDNSIRSQQFPFNFTFFYTSASHLVALEWKQFLLNLFQCFQYLWFDVPNQETSNTMRCV